MSTRGIVSGSTRRPGQPGVCQSLSPYEDLTERIQQMGQRNRCNAHYAVSATIVQIYHVIQYDITAGEYDIRDNAYCLIWLFRLKKRMVCSADNFCRSEEHTSELQSQS